MKKPGFVFLCTTLLVLFFISFNSCEKDPWLVEEENLEKYVLDSNVTVEPKESGLYYLPIVEGQGDAAVSGKKVKVEYAGWLIDGSVFDSGTFEFTLGYGIVIKGWDEGIAYMKEGGKARLVIPSWLGYSNNRNIPDIPPYSTLIFEVNLLDVK